jgi:hypothetical protein
MVQIIQIVPTLPPLIGGVGDYAHCLAIQLVQDVHLSTHFLVSGQAWAKNVQEPLLLYAVSPFSHTQISLLKALNTHVASDSTVLLHYVGYGYSKYGTPTWLIEGLEDWKSQHPTGRLVTMFHEIAASGPPWSRAFWLSNTQRRLAQRLVQISDRILTSKQLYANILERFSQGRFHEIPTLPVFSTVGELSNPPDLPARQRHLVVFGGRGQRAKVYQSSIKQLHQICRYLDIQQIFDIGPTINSIPTYIDDVPITATGSLPSNEVSDILSRAIAGFFSYHPAFLGKSTIFAAYCAHRVIPISATMSDFLEEGLQPGRHYALPTQYNTEKRDMALMQAIADEAYVWYQGHSLSVQAQAYYTLLSDLKATQL